jgi:hypothetical protein
MNKEQMKKLRSIIDDTVTARIEINEGAPVPEHAFKSYQELVDYTSSRLQSVPNDDKIVNKIELKVIPVSTMYSEPGCVLPKTWSSVYLGHGIFTPPRSVVLKIWIGPLDKHDVPYRFAIWVENPDDASQFLPMMVSLEELSLIADKRYTNMWLFKAEDKASGV